MNIKIRNALFLITALLAVILLLAGITYSTTRIIVEKTISDHQKNIVAHAAASTETWLKQQMQVMNSVKERIESTDLNKQDSILQVFTLAMKAGAFSDVYLGLTDGTMIDGAGWIPPNGYDPRTRPWYKNGKLNNKVSLTKPYLDMTTEKMVIAMTTPIYKNNEFAGVISADMILDSLVDSVLKIKVVDMGHSFIVADDGTFMVHKNQSLLLKHKLQDLDPSLKNVMHSFLQTSQGTYNYAVNNDEYILAYHYIKSVGWYLCTTMTLKDAYALSGRTSMLSTMDSVLKMLAILAIVSLIGVGGSALILLVYDKKFKTTVKKHQDVITGMNEDLKWNISRRKEVETHYQTLFHVANDAIMVSKGTIFVECNEKAKEMFGASQYGIIGDNMLDLSPLYQADGQSSYTKLQNIINHAGMGEQQFFQWTFLRNNGSEFPAEVSLKNLHLNNEQLILMSIRDISKRTTAEQQLRQAQKMAAMGEMLGAIAHQWRQPLNTLSTYVLSIQSAYYNKMINKDFIEKLVTSADSQIQFMSKTIDDFRHFFKPSKNKEAFTLIKAVENAIKLLEPTFRQGGITIETTPTDDYKDIKVYGYQSEFAHVIVNILSNARDAVLEKAPKGVEDEKLIKIDFEDNDSSVNITITDSGKGIPKHIIGKIFDPYFTTKGTATGTGIGLYMSKTIVENEMNGELQADNSDKGARFTIILPKYGNK